MKKLLLLLALLGLATPAAAQNPFSLINFGSTAVDTNSGNKSAGTLRVVLATDGTNPTTVFKIDLSGTSANATAIKVDGSAVTQPVSLASVPSHAVTNAGTFAVQAAESGTWNITNVSGTVSLPTGAATAAKQPALGTAGTASSDVITVQGIASMTALKVDPSAVTSPISAASLPLPALASTSTKQSDGSQKTQIVDGSGNVIASTSNNLNVQCANCSGSGVSAADEATFTAGTSVFAAGGGFFQTTATSNALTTGQQGAFQVTANRALFSNLRNAAGTEVGTSSTPFQVTLANTGANATAVKVDGSAATQPVSGTVTANQGGTWTVQPGNTANTTPWLTTDSATSATGAAVPAKASYVGGLGSGATGGLLAGATACDTDKNITVTSATTTLMITGVASQKVHICALHLMTGVANNVALVEGTGATCGTGTAGMAGGTTAANGWNFAANGGLALGAGFGDVITTATTGDSVCLITSAVGPLAGHIKYAIY